MSLTSPVFYTVESVTLPMIKAGLHPVNIYNRLKIHAILKNNTEGTKKLNATEIPQNLMQALK